MKLRRKLLLTYSLVSVLFFVVLALSVIEMSKVARENRVLLNQRLPAIEATDDIRDALVRQYVYVLQALLVSPTVIDDDVVAIDQQLRERLSAARRDLVSPAEDAIAQHLEDTYDELWNHLQQWRESGASTPPDRRILALRFAETRAAAQSLSQMQLTALSQTADVAYQRATLSMYLIPLLGALTLLLGVGVSIRFVRRITAPLEELAHATQRLAGGEFDLRINPSSKNDEINELAHRFMEMAAALAQFARLNVEKLIAERRRSEAVLESISDGLVILDEKGCIERVNPVAQRQLGPFEVEPLGRPIGELLLDPAIDAQVQANLGLAAGDATPVSHELKVERQGDARILSYSLLPFAEPGASGHGLIVTLRDVTMEREFEAMRNSFVMRASHELRTPVTSIRMGLELLAERLNLQPGSPERELMDTTLVETQRLVRLLGDLLDLSRFQSGEQSFHRQPTDIGDILTRACQRFRTPAEDAGITLSCELAQCELPVLNVDRMQIDRVLDNLVSNALRYTPRGGRVTLRAARNGNGVLIGVSDTGDGIALSQQARIFKPFVQVGEKRGGAGLGLAIAHEIVQQHGGDISLQSAPHCGTTFSVQLPG